MPPHDCIDFSNLCLDISLLEKHDVYSPQYAAAYGAITAISAENSSLEPFFIRNRFFRKLNTNALTATIIALLTILLLTLSAIDCITLNDTQEELLVLKSKQERYAAVFDAQQEAQRFSTDTINREHLLEGLSTDKIAPYGMLATLGKITADGAVISAVDITPSGKITVEGTATNKNAVATLMNAADKEPLFTGLLALTEMRADNDILRFTLTDSPP